MTNLIHEISESGIHDHALVDELKQRYERWHQSALDRLDGWAEQYPDFVGDMQELLAERLILSVEADVLTQEVENGAIAHAMGEAMLAELRYKIRKLAIPSLSVLHLEPVTLLAALPFLNGANSEDLQALSSRLITKTVGAESNIILQGDAGKTLYIISRGVVRVYRHEQNHDTRQRVATLIAGDYFGEFAFLNNAPRNATCKSVTVCSLYELSRADFNAVLSKRPSLREIFERQSSGRIVIDPQRKARTDH